MNNLNPVFCLLKKLNVEYPPIESRTHSLLIKDNSLIIQLVVNKLFIPLLLDVDDLNKPVDELFEEIKDYLSVNKTLDNF